MARAPFALACKTFRGDLEHFALLLASVEAHNPERIPFVVIVPDADRAAFADRFGRGRFTCVADEAIATEPPTGFAWVDQQVVKLAFWRLDVAEAYLVLDADFRVLRDIATRDFVDGDGTARIVLAHEPHVWEDAPQAVRDALLRGAPLPAVSAEACRAWARAARVPAPRGPLERLLKPRFRTEPQRWTRRPGAGLWMMPGPVVAHRALASLHDEFLSPGRMRASELLFAFPYEYTWLGEWALARFPDAVRPIPPTFLNFRTDAGLRDARAAGLTDAAIARHYAGVALAARHHDHMTF